MNQKIFGLTKAFKRFGSEQRIKGTTLPIYLFTEDSLILRNKILNPLIHTLTDLIEICNISAFQKRKKMNCILLEPSKKTECT